MSDNAKDGEQARAPAAEEELGMLRDLEALTPSLVVCVAILVAVVVFLRRQLGASAKPQGEYDSARILDGGSNSADLDRDPDRDDDPRRTSASDPGHSSR